MRRAPVVLTATVAGTAAVLGFHAHRPSLPAALAARQASAPASGSGAGARGASAATGATRASGTKTATGDTVETRYGPVQVRVTIAGGRITAVQALQLPSDDPKSVEIASYAEPQLRQSALAKQSAAIDAVSGATITSDAYEASLQSALDKAGFTAADDSRGTTTVPNVQEGPGGGGSGYPGGPDGGGYGGGG